MKRSIKNLITMALIGSAMLITLFTSNANGKSLDQQFFGVTVSNSAVGEFYSDDNHDSDFWSKFRESVMPDDKKTPPQEVDDKDITSQRKNPKK